MTPGRFALALLPALLLAGPTRAELAPPNFAFEPVYVSGFRPGPTAEQLALADTETVGRYNLGGSSDPSHPSNLPNYHPAPRVVVTAETVRPRPARDAARIQGRIQAGARRLAYWPIRSCYEPGLRERETLSGQLKFRITLGARGSVLGARLLSTDLADKSVARCVVDAFRKLRLEHGAGKKLDVDWKVSLYPGHARVPTPAVGAAVARSKLPVPAQAADERVAEQRAAVEACLVESRRADPRLWGRLALELTLDANGAVTRAVEVESTFPNARAVACVAGVLEKVRFPAPSNAPAALVVALRLEPDQPGPPPAPPSPVLPEPPAPQSSSVPVKSSLGSSESGLQ